METPMRLVFLALPALLAACGGSSADSASADTATSTGATADGAALYATHCAGCHGASGQGGSGPSLRDEVPDASDAELRDIIVNGDGSMPAIPVPADDLPVLIDYLRVTFG
jgi:mono/diheme cytochrome c family protein